MSLTRKEWVEYFVASPVVALEVIDEVMRQTEMVRMASEIVESEGFPDKRSVVRVTLLLSEFLANTDEMLLSARCDVSDVHEFRPEEWEWGELEGMIAAKLGV